MNGGVECLLSEEVIDLTRGPSGLGFNIVGGVDQQHISNDAGFFVSRIKENGAAALDGRLQEGDRILTVWIYLLPIGNKPNISGSCRPTTFGRAQLVYPCVVPDYSETNLGVFFGDAYSQVNGKELKNMLHQHAVDLFRNAGDNVSLKVQHRLVPPNGPSSHRGDREAGGIPLAMILVPGLAVTVAAIWAYFRYRQRL